MHTPPGLNRVSRFIFGLLALLSISALSYMLMIGQLDDRLQLMTPLLAAGSVLFLLLWWLSIRRALNQQQHDAQQRYRQQMQWQTALQQLAAGELTITDDTPEAIRAVVAPVQQLVKKTRAVHLQLLNSSHEMQASTLHLQETTGHQQDQLTQVLTQHQALTQQLTQFGTQAQDAQGRVVQVQQTLTQLAGIEEAPVLTDLQHRQQAAEEHLQQAAAETQTIQQQISLIADLADQSNILALNTAIQAALAGEAGRAFRVVGEEVQRLAQQANDSTRQISSLLQTIQSHQQAGLQQLQCQAEQLNVSSQDHVRQRQQLVQLSADSNGLAEHLTRWCAAAEQQTETARLLGDQLHIIYTIGQQTTESVTQATEATAALNTQLTPLETALAPYQPQPVTDQPVLSATA